MDFVWALKKGIFMGRFWKKGHLYGWVLKRKKALVRAGFDKKGHLYGRVLKKRALVWVGFEEEEKALVWAGFEEEKKALVWAGFEKRHLYGRALKKGTFMGMFWRKKGTCMGGQVAVLWICGASNWICGPTRHFHCPSHRHWSKQRSWKKRESYLFVACLTWLTLLLSTKSCLVIEEALFKMSYLPK